MAASLAPVCQFVDCPFEQVELPVEFRVTAFRPGVLLASRESARQQARPTSGSIGGISQDGTWRLESRLVGAGRRKLTPVQYGQNAAHQNHQDSHTDGGAAGADEGQDRDDRCLPSP